MNGRSVALALLVTVLAGSGCSSMEGGESRPTTLIPARTLNVSPSLTIPAESIAAAGIIFVVIDPLAPNWKVEVESLGARRYRIEMTMKRFITGGEGESGAVLRRAAEKLRQKGGYSGYAVLEHAEGIESKVLIAQRVAHAVIELH
jgi:hypothetical protein